jgi:trehalose utilization protein
MNYYIDDEMLTIKEKNIFTAIEIATLMPLRGIDTFRNFFQQNKWANDFLPNHNMYISYVKENRRSLLKNIIEWIFDNKAGNQMDSVFMNITAHKWSAKTKMKKLNRNGVVMSLDAGKHYAKPSPENFQMKLLQRYEMKLYAVYRQFEQRAGSNVVKW